MDSSIRLNPPPSAASTAQPVDRHTSPSYAGLPKEMISIIFNLIHTNFLGYSKLPLVCKSFSKLSNEIHPLHQQAVLVCYTGSERLGAYQSGCVNDDKYMKIVDTLMKFDPKRALLFLEEVIKQLGNSINLATKETSKNSVRQLVQIISSLTKHRLKLPVNVDRLFEKLKSLRYNKEFFKSDDPGVLRTTKLFESSLDVYYSNREVVYSFQGEIDQCLERSNPLNRCVQILKRTSDYHTPNLDWVAQELFSGLFPHFSEGLSEKCLESGFGNKLFNWSISVQKFDFAFELHKKIIQKIRDNPDPTINMGADSSQLTMLRKMVEGVKKFNPYMHDDLLSKISLEVEVIAARFFNNTGIQDDQYRMLVQCYCDRTNDLDKMRALVDSIKSKSLKIKCLPFLIMKLEEMKHHDLSDQYLKKLDILISEHECASGTSYTEDRLKMAEIYLSIEKEKSKTILLEAEKQFLPWRDLLPNQRNYRLSFARIWWQIDPKHVFDKIYPESSNSPESMDELLQLAGEVISRIN